MTLPAYLPILFLVILAMLFAIASVVAASKLSPKKWTPAKLLPYESGIVPEEGNDRERFPVKFYLVAMLFIIFDIETVFMIPWGVYFRQLSCAVPLAASGVCPAGNITFFGLGEMLVFMAILLVGFVYVWKKGALRWD